ncbi:MAG: acyl carrier protein [Thermoguttaceae bacterium]|jgi:acyl carrier protein|nr:acyl carrier protein [Thermoguttaceae bacterium]
MTANHELPASTRDCRESVLHDVKRIVAEQVGTPPDGILAEHRLEEDLGCDSLMLVEITMELEEHFDISIPDEQAEYTRRIGDIVDGVLRLLEG